MDLLYVTEGIPTRDPARSDGSAVISFELVRHLHADVSITLVAFGSEHEVPEEIRTRCAEVHVFALGSMFRSNVRSLISGRSAGAYQRSSAKSRRAIVQLSERADVTLLHGPNVILASASSPSGPLVAQIVDPWSHRSSMEAQAATGWRRRYWRRVSRNAFAAEQNLPVHARLLTVGQQDATRWSSQLGRPVRSIGIGVSAQPGPSATAENGAPTICFVGGLNYAPNVESAQILVNEIAPRIWSEIPDVRVVIAGRQPDPAVLALESPRVAIRANVPSITEIFSTSHAAVFPDRRGLGVRLSVTEALAAGIPVFATSIAAREQSAHPLLHIAEDPEALAKSICEEILNPQARPESALRTWDEVTAEYQEELELAVAND